MFLTDTIISHRGIHNNKNKYENTLEAFNSAKEKGYIIELDIHLTKDNQMIVFHDDNIKRITGIDKLVEKSTYKELNQQKKIHLPKLTEVLTLINGEVPLLIEIKNNHKPGILETKLMTILENYPGKYAIQSFNPRVVLWLKRHYPQVLRGQLSCQYKNQKMNSIKKYLLKNMIFNIITKPNFISYKYDEISISKIKKYQRKKIILLGWTVQTQKEYDKYIKYFDNLICEKFI